MTLSGARTGAGFAVVAGSPLAQLLLAWMVLSYLVVGGQGHWSSGVPDPGLRRQGGPNALTLQGCVVAAVVVVGFPRRERPWAGPFLGSWGRGAHWPHPALRAKAQRVWIPLPCLLLPRLEDTARQEPVRRA